MALYGGIPWHVSESSRRDDSVVGLGLDVRPFASTRLTASYTHLEDVYEQLWVDDSSRASASDDLLGLELRQNLLGGLVHLYGAYSNLNGRSRDTSARLTVQSPSGTWRTSLDYRSLFATQNALSTELDLYYSVLRSYHPFHELRADTDWCVTENWNVGAGIAIRRMDRQRDAGPFNHDFERYYLTTTFAEWPLARAPLTLVANLFAADGDRFWEVEADWRLEITETLSVDVGSGYALYQEDRYTFEERDHVRSLFARVEYAPTESVAITGRYVAEDADDGTTHSFEAGIRYRF